MQRYLLLYFLLLLGATVLAVSINDESCQKEDHEGVCNSEKTSSARISSSAKEVKPGVFGEDSREESDISSGEEDTEISSEQMGDKKVFMELLGAELKASRDMIQLQEERIKLLERLRDRVLADNSFYAEDRKALMSFIRPEEHDDASTAMLENAHRMLFSFESSFAASYLEAAKEAAHMGVAFIQLRGSILSRALQEGYSDLISVPCTAFLNGSLVFVDPLKSHVVYVYDTGHAAPITRLQVSNYPSDLIFTVDANEEIRIHNYSVFFQSSRIAGRAKRAIEDEDGPSPIAVRVNLEKVIQASSENMELISMVSVYVGRAEKLALGYSSGRVVTIDRYGETSEMVNFSHPVEAMAWRSPYLAVVQDEKIEFVRAAQGRAHANTCQAPFGQKLGNVEYDLFTTGMIYAGTHSGQVLVFDPVAKAQSTVSSRKSSARTVCRLAYQLDMVEFLEEGSIVHTPTIGSLRGYLVVAVANKLVVYNVTQKRNTPDVVLVKTLAPPASTTPIVMVAKVGHGVLSHTRLILGSYSTENLFGMFDPLLPYHVPEKKDFLGYFRAPMMVIILVVAFGYNFAGKRGQNRASAREHMRRQAPFGASYGGRNASLEQEMDAYLRQAELRASSRMGAKAAQRSAGSKKGKKSF